MLVTLKKIMLLLVLIALSVTFVVADEVGSDTINYSKRTSVGKVIERVKRDSKDTVFISYSDVSVSFVGDELKSIYFGRNGWIFNNNEVKSDKIDRRAHYKFNGHWAGVAISLNGYMSGAFNTNMPVGYDYMGLRYEKSAGIYLNLFEVNCQLVKSGRNAFGLFTGLGYEFHNYRFNNNVMIDMHDKKLSGYMTQNAIGDNVMRKSKLEVEYVTAPLIFEYQYSGRRKVNDFHIGAGAVIGVTTFSHTKVKFYQPYTNYNILNYYTGEIVDRRQTGGDLIYKNRYLGLNPFKCDIIATIGFAGLNFFVTHSVTNMFKKDAGAKLYPWSVGIILLGW